MAENIVHCNHNVIRFSKYFWWIFCLLYNDFIIFVLLKYFHLKYLSFIINWTSLLFIEFKNLCKGGNSLIKIINLCKLWHVIFSAKFTYNIAALYLIVFVCYLIFGFASPHLTPQLHVCSIKILPQSMRVELSCTCNYCSSQIR